MSLDCTDDQSTLVQVMAWCRQATSHYLSQCWPRSISPYGITRPQWVNTSGAETGIFQDHEVNTMAADALAPWVARTSATTVLTVQDKWLLALHEEGFQLPVPSCYWERVENANMFLYFIKLIQATRVKTPQLLNTFWSLIHFTRTLLRGIFILKVMVVMLKKNSPNSYPSAIELSFQSTKFFWSRILLIFFLYVKTVYIWFWNQDIF